MANKDLRRRLQLAVVDKLRSFQEKVKKSINKDTMGELADETRAQIRRGISPVEGIGKYQKYSQTYLDAIKKGHGDADQKRGKRSPVDMTLSGDMLRSLDIVERGTKTYLEFDDEKAYYHNNSGAGKSRVIRRLLPDADGEKFNRVLSNKFLKIIRGIVKKTRP